MFLERGVNARRSGDLILAINIDEEAASQFSEWVPIYFELARTYEMANQLENAKASIEKSIELMFPENPVYYIKAGNIYEALGENQQAEISYEKALEIDMNNEDAQYALRRVLTSQ